MIKADLQSLINTNLATASDITAIELRAVEDAFLNELYPATIIDTHLTTNVFTDLGTGVGYYLNITKNGNNVHINGNVRNDNAFIIGNIQIAQITNLIYKPFGILLNNDVNIISSTGLESILMKINNTGTNPYLEIIGNLDAGFMTYFNFNYKTND